MQTRWDKWLPSLVSACLVIGALGTFALSNESRISSLETKMVAMESGLSTPMAKDTRERFDALAAQLKVMSEGLQRVELRLYEHSEKLSRINGKLFPKSSSEVPVEKPVTPGSIAKELGE